MIEINLLPKEYQKRTFSLSMGKTGLYAMVGGVGVIIMLVAVTFYQIHQLNTLEENIQKARQRAAVLQKDIRIVDALIDVKTKINNRMLAVDKLDSHRTAWVRILEDFARNVPDFVWMTKFEEVQPEAKKPTGKKNEEQEEQVVSTSKPEVQPVTIEGYSFTLNALATMMINMMRSDYFDSIELISSEEHHLDAEKKYKAYNFVLSCNLHYLSDEQLRDLIAQAKTEKNKGKSKTSHKVLN